MDINNVLRDHGIGGAKAIKSGTTAVIYTQAALS